MKCTIFVNNAYYNMIPKLRRHIVKLCNRARIFVIISRIQISDKKNSAFNSIDVFNFD